MPHPTPDPDAVAVLAACLHQECPPPKPRGWSAGHFAGHDRLAKRLVASLDSLGKEIANKEH